MSIRDYLLLAFKNKAYRHRQWVLSVMSMVLTGAFAFGGNTVDLQLAV